MDDGIQNEVWYFRMARDSVRFGQCFKHFSEIYQLGFQGFFDEFCSVYVDDILIDYTDGSRTEYQKQINFF